MEPLSARQSKHFEIQTHQDNKDLLSNTDRKVNNSTILRQIFVSLGAFLAFDALIISCIVTPALLGIVIPTALFVAYRIFSAPKTAESPPVTIEADALESIELEPTPELSYVEDSSVFQPCSLQGHATGLKNQHLECFINSGLQLFEGTPNYEEVIGSHRHLEILRKAHINMNAALHNKQEVADVDTHEIRVWLREQTKYVDRLTGETKYKITREMGQDDAAILFEYVTDHYPDLPFYAVRYKPDPRDRVFEPVERKKYIEVALNSPNFIANLDRSFNFITDLEWHYVRRLRRPPSDCFIYLNRFTNDGPFMAKNNTAINVPESFTLEAGKHTLNGSAIYEVDRFIQHIGETQQGGHYVTFKKMVIDGRMVYARISDTIITQVSKDDFFREMQQAYILHITKKS